jgi:hypothetical protein
MYVCMWKHLIKWIQMRQADASCLVTSEQGTELFFPCAKQIEMHTHAHTKPNSTPTTLYQATFIGWPSLKTCCVGKWSRICEQALPPRVALRFKNDGLYFASPKRLNSKPAEYGLQAGAHLACTKLAHSEPARPKPNALHQLMSPFLRSLSGSAQALCSYNQWLWCWT